MLYCNEWLDKKRVVLKLAGGRGVGNFGAPVYELQDFAPGRFAVAVLDFGH